MRRLLAVVLLLPAVYGQQCAAGQDQGPCQAGGKCDTGQICITDTPDGVFVCCPFASVVTTTAAPTTTTTTSPASAATTATTATPCVDKINPSTGKSDCPGISYLCNDPTYKALMKDQCPLTCGYCGTSGSSGGATTPAACVDKINPSTGKSDCPGVAYLCQNPAYKDLMKDQCPKTCGYCT